MKTVVNLTPETVIGEIDKVLDTYSYDPYQKVFAIPDLRQELVDFVFNRIPCFQNITGFDNECLLDKFPRGSLETQLHVQNIINQGIFTIIQAKSDWISNCLSETVHPACEPSHWFG